MASVAFEGVGKRYPNGTYALRDLTLEVAEGDLLVLVGPSGCGKTTALRAVAGLEEVTDGQIRIDDVVVNDLTPRQRDVAMVFQNYALYPHMTVFDNIAFPLRAQSLSRDERRKRVTEAAESVGLGAELRRKPRTLSGGQRQRVAMARAMVRRPRLFLMDEPLSNLDAKLRVQMRGEIGRMQADLGITTIFVTHDQVEALTMGSYVAVMRHGVLQQHGRPQNVYDNPVNLFVATFIGSPAMNLVEAELTEAPDGYTVRCGSNALGLPASAIADRPALRSYIGRRLAFGVRLEHLSQPTGDAAARPRLRGEVRFVESLGSDKHVEIAIDAKPVVSDSVLEVAADVDPTALVALREEGRAQQTVVVARLPAHAKIDAGEPIEVAVETDHLHFFDLETGVAIRT